ncbi:MAG: RecX family transcriptional regulator [Deltaproteobacteria bacterium]|nr:RecX family transcriptional regulator [Deltaproteobacteria bacterium]
MIRRVDELGYINDEEYTKRRALLKAKQGYGDAYIRYFLKRLLIPEELIERALHDIPDEISEEKRILMNIKKRRGIQREKLIRYLSNRGFAYETILNTLDGDT